MSVHLTFRPRAQGADTLDATFTNVAGHVNLAYTNSLWAAGWTVQLWGQTNVGARQKFAEYALQNQAIFDTTFSVGFGVGWFVRTVDTAKELVAESGQTTM